MAFINPYIVSTPTPGQFDVLGLMTEREGRVLRNLTPAQAEAFGALATEVERERLEKRAIRAKSVEAAEVIGTAAALGFVKGYYPDFTVLGFSPALAVGVLGHGSALYAAHEGAAKGDREMQSYEPHLEHVGNGALAVYVYEELTLVGARLRAAKLAKAAQQKPN